MRLRMGGLSRPEIGPRRSFLMTPQVLHDTLRIFGTSLSVAIGAVAVAVFGTLLWSESSASRALRAAVARRRRRAHDNRSILQITMRPYGDVPPRRLCVARLQLGRLYYCVCLACQFVRKAIEDSSLHEAGAAERCAAQTK